MVDRNRVRYIVPIPTCPRCKERMHLVLPRQGQSFDPFWGCVNYRRAPEPCRESAEVEEVEVMSERGKA